MELLSMTSMNVYQLYKADLLISRNIGIECQMVLKALRQAVYQRNLEELQKENPNQRLCLIYNTIQLELDDAAHLILVHMEG